MVARWYATDPSSCEEWDNNSVNGNFITGFQHGIEWGNARQNCQFAGNRFDFNDIRDCNTGIIELGTNVSVSRLLIHQNSITAGRNYANTPGGQDDNGSNDIWLNDSDHSDVIGNRITGVQRGIHLSDHACWTRVKRNQIEADGGVPADRDALAVCPSHCNWLIDNEITIGDQNNGDGIDFTNRGAFQTKPHGTHVIDGGVIHDAQCVTRKASTATLTFGTLPARARYPFLDCQ